jgi:hypothetical protein
MLWSFEPVSVISDPLYMSGVNCALIDLWEGATFALQAVTMSFSIGSDLEVFSPSRFVQHQGECMWCSSCASIARTRQTHSERYSDIRRLRWKGILMTYMTLGVRE